MVEIVKIMDMMAKDSGDKTKQMNNFVSSIS